MRWEDETTHTSNVLDVFGAEKIAEGTARASRLAHLEKRRKAVLGKGDHFYGVEGSDDAFDDREAAEGEDEGREVSDAGWGQF